MADSCSLYISKKNTEIVSFFAENDFGGRVRFISYKDKSEWEKIEITWSDLKITITKYGKDFKGFIQEVEGLSNYIFFLSDKKMNDRIFNLLEKIQRTNYVFGVVIEPGFDSDRRWEEVIKGISGYLNGIIFHNFAVYDNNLKLYLGKNMIFQPESQIPIFDSALKRKKKSESEIDKLKIPYNGFLPPIVSEEEVIMRAPEEIAKRAVILTLLAVRAEGMGKDLVIKSLRKQGLYNFLTPKEIDFIENSQPSEDDILNFYWGYEAAYTLFWATGFFDKQVPPSEIFNYENLQILINKKNVQELIKNAKLRETSQILDVLDYNYRLHWSTKNVKSEIIQDKIDLGVVFERHYALNWIINYMNQSWDDVSTNT